MYLLKKLFKGDPVIWIIFAILCVYSLVFVFSATSTIVYKNDNMLGPITRHFGMLALGFTFGILVTHNIPYRFFKIGGLVLPLVVLLLIYTIFFGVEINGEKRWLEIFGIQFQPSELAKLSLISYIALVLSKRGQLTDQQIFVWILGGAFAVCAAIFPTNGSTALLIFGFTLLMMIIGQVSWKRIGQLIGILAAIAVVGILVLKFTPDSIGKHIPRFKTWQARIERFTENEPMINENGTIKDEYYQVVYAQIAIAEGNIIGKGPGYGDQRDFLPQAYSDFIYAIILEEGGLIPGVFLLFVYLALLVRVGMIAKKCERLYPKYLVIGCGLLLGIQALTNMAVAVHLIPVTGQPLPLISRGGTSTIISCFYIGIILSVSRFAANIGNEEDELPPEEVKPEAVPVTITQEEIAHWVLDAPEGITMPEAKKGDI